MAITQIWLGQTKDPVTGLTPIRDKAPAKRCRNKWINLKVPSQEPVCLHDFAGNSRHPGNWCFKYYAVNVETGHSVDFYYLGGQWNSKRTRPVKTNRPVYVLASQVKFDEATGTITFPPIKGAHEVSRQFDWADLMNVYYGSRTREKFLASPLGQTYPHRRVIGQTRNAGREFTGKELRQMNEAAKSLPLMTAPFKAIEYDPLAYLYVVRNISLPTAPVHFRTFTYALAVRYVAKLTGLQIPPVQRLPLP